MKNNNLNWKAYTLDDLREMFKGCEHWFLDGGVALDVFLGRHTRSHGDIDIGVFSTDVEGLLLYLSEKGFDIYEANGGLTQYAPSAHKSSVYNYWVSDGANFIVQVLVYTLVIIG